MVALVEGLAEIKVDRVKVFIILQGRQYWYGMKGMKGMKQNMEYGSLLQKNVWGELLGYTLNTPCFMIP